MKVKDQYKGIKITITVGRTEEVYNFERLEQMTELDIYNLAIHGIDLSYLFEEVKVEKLPVSDEEPTVKVKYEGIEKKKRGKRK